MAVNIEDGRAVRGAIRGGGTSRGSAGTGGCASAGCRDWGEGGGVAGGVTIPLVREEAGFSVCHLDQHPLLGTCVPSEWRGSEGGGRER